MLYIDKLISTLATAPRNKAVLRYRDEDMSSSQFLELVSGAVAYLAEAGIARSHSLALLAPNRPEAIAMRYAAHLLGSATCYLSSPASSSARSQLLKNIGPDLLVAFPETEHLLPTNPGCRVQIVHEVRPRDHEAMRASVAVDSDLAVIVSSGGSTGVPKGSCRDFKAYTSAVSGPSGPDRRQLVNGPLAYLSQILIDVTLMNGGCVVLRDRFDPADTLAQIESHAITDLFLVEPQMFELMDHPHVHLADLSSLRRLVHVGASAPEALRRRASRRLGNCIMHTYGASEMGIVSALPIAEYGDDFTSAGRIVEGVEVRLRMSDGTLEGQGHVGIIEVRSAAMAQGYRNCPELAATSFDGGWYHSGDMGWIDEWGKLHILGRASDIEMIEGVFITPGDIENLLCGLSCVRYAVVVSDLPSKRRVAAVEAWPHQALNLAECRGAIAGQFPEEVANTVVLVPYGMIPRTEQGKPDRAQILDDAASPLVETGRSLSDGARAPAGCPPRA